MIGIKQLGLIDQRLREIFPAHQDEVFAGANIFICGDFNQLPPIGAQVMYAFSSKTNADYLSGQQAYRALNTTVRLAQLMRQDGDDEESGQFRQALSELRQCNVSLATWNLLSTRVHNRLTLQETATFDDALRLYSPKEQVR